MVFDETVALSLWDYTGIHFESVLCPPQQAMDSITFDAMERISWDPPLQEENLNRPQARDSMP